MNEDLEKAVRNLKVAVFFICLAVILQIIALVFGR